MSSSTSCHAWIAQQRKFSQRRGTKTHRIELCVQQLSIVDESLDGGWGCGEEVQEVGVLLGQVGHEAADLHAQ